MRTLLHLSSLKRKNVAINTVVSRTLTVSYDLNEKKTFKFLPFGMITILKFSLGKCNKTSPRIYILLISLSIKPYISVAQSAGGVESTNCISAEE